MRSVMLYIYILYRLIILSRITPLLLQTAQVKVNWSKNKIKIILLTLKTYIYYYFLTSKKLTFKGSQFHYLLQSLNH
jgi:hypothetical protein